MSDERATRIREISAALSDRALVWFGIRGEDAAPLLAIPQLTTSLSITAALQAGKLDVSESLERLTNHRVDLDTYDIDLDDRMEVSALRTALMRALARRSAVVTYRPSTFLSDATFASVDTARSLALFKDRQLAFEHKPWVETELAARGVRTIPWTYVPTERRGRLPLGEGRPPLVVRPSHSSGGVGISVVSSKDELEAAWTSGPAGLMGVSRFLSDAVPLNVNGCVFDHETVSVHAGSVQLIGLEGWTSRRFGFCGNDFGAIDQVPPSVLDELDATTRTVGRWLGEMGYRGAFGVDFLLEGDTLHFAEVNARMQGSTRMSCQLAARAGLGDVVLDHLAVFLGLGPAAEERTVRQWRQSLGEGAQVIKHHLDRIPRPAPAPHGRLAPPGTTFHLLPAGGTQLDPGAVEYCVEVDGVVTTTGFDLVHAGLRRLVAGTDAEATR